jgi:hypothetical protein
MAMKSLSFCFMLFVLFNLASLEAQDSPATPSPTVQFDSYFEIFPMGLVCSEAESGLGPTWRNITIGESSLFDIEAEYGKSFAWNDMLRISDFEVGWDIVLCVEKKIITAIKVGSELPYLEDYVELYGEPDVVTWSNTASRLLFWFDEGIAIDVYVNPTVARYYGLVSFVVYFPYQDLNDYEDKWPFNQTLTEGLPDGDLAIPDEQNPFDFNAILATITAEPSYPPTATVEPLVPTATP